MEKSHLGLEGVAEGPLGALDFGAIYLSLRLLSDGGQMPCDGHVNVPRGLASPGSCPFMFAPMELFS